jgi:di/tricarboxylate transporter
MDIGSIALIMLFVVIAIGFWKKLNVGILAIAAAVILGYGSGEFKGKQIIGGFSSSLFMTLLGVTLFFGLVQYSGALELLMRKLVAFFGKQVWMIPIMIYVIGFTIAAVGPGCVPALAFVAALSIPLSHQTGFDAVMLMLIGDMGTFGGRFSPITPEGVLIFNLMDKQGFAGFSLPVFINATIGSILLALLPYLYYKGYKVRANSEIKAVALEKFTVKQFIALASIVVMVLGVIFLKMDVGLASFLVAIFLILTGVGSEKEAIKSVPWNTIIMVTGVGVLMNIVISTGGIDTLAASMAKMMTPKTATAIMGTSAGVMSWFSSAIGVVMPTLIPTVGSVATQVGGNIPVTPLVTVIGIFASVAGISPASTGGAIILGAYSGDPEYGKSKRNEKLFIECLIWSVVFVIILALFALLGVFGVIV